MYCLLQEVMLVYNRAHTPTTIAVTVSVAWLRNLLNTPESTP
jgi:hypothetical protein